MNVIVKGKNTVVSPALSEYLEKKLVKLTKQFKSVGDVTCLFKVERNNHIVEISFPAGSIMLRAEESTKDMYASIDLALEKIERQIHKYKTRLAKRKYSNFVEPVPEVEEVPEDELVIIKNKRFQLEPMTAEEAILQMNLINHDFFVYFDPDMNNVNVVYKRKDGKYGLIVPELK